VDEDRWVEVAIVSRPHGVQGELKVTLHNKDSEVLFNVDEVLVRMPDGEEHEVSVDGVRPADQAVLLRLYSVGDRDRAEGLRGAKILVRRSQFAPLEPGEFYACDIEGARAVLAAEGDAPERHGIVHRLVNYPSVDVLVIEIDGATYEVPLVSAFVLSVDAKARLVTLKTLEGIESERPRPASREASPSSPEDAPSSSPDGAAS
jgi:16S rRNA processing protein RimM